MRSERDDLSILPDEELRELYKSAKRKQKFLSLSLFVSGILLALSLIDLITDIVRLGHFSSSVADTIFAFAMGAAFVAMTAVFSENTRSDLCAGAAHPGSADTGYQRRHSRSGDRADSACGDTRRYSADVLPAGDASAFDPGNSIRPPGDPRP